MMNATLIWLNVLGAVLIAASGLKVIETSGALSVAAKIVVLAMVLLAVCAALEALSCNRPTRPLGSILLFLVGAVWAYKAFMPFPAPLLTRPWPWRSTPTH